MFNKIQNNLLLRYPLLWNIKIVPLLIATLAIHAIFFLIGYGRGSIDFTETGFGYSWDSDAPTIIFFSVLLSLLVFIMWLVFYFRNNAFKSLYPKSNASLYKEWLLILVICLLNSSYTATFSYAQDFRKTSYFSEKETMRRLDIISMASLFADGNLHAYTKYNNGYNVDYAVDTAAVATDTVTAEVTPVVEERGPISLLDKGVYQFGNYRYRRSDAEYKNTDSINNVRVNSWLRHNRKDSVLWLFKEFDKIAKSHALQSNITPEQWLDLVYHYPDFTNYEVIARNNGINNDDEFGYERAYSSNIYVNPKYYVPMSQLTHNYEKIHDASYSPTVDKNVGLIYVALAVSLSMLVFSFRVTSGRSWLIALVSLGIAAMVVGLFSFALQEGTSYPIIWLLIIIALLVYFISVTASKTKKGPTDIILNCILWLMMWLIPLICGIIVITQSYHRYSSDYSYTEEHPVRDWIEHNVVTIGYINLAFIMLYMFFASVIIKKWKGLAEA